MRGCRSPSLPLGECAVRADREAAVTSCRHHGHDQHHHDHGGCHHHHHHFGGERLQLGLAIAAALLLTGGWSLQQFRWTEVPASTWLIGLSIICGGFFATIDALLGLLARRFQIDFLMVLAALGAVSIGHAAEGALLLVLFSLGHAAEHYALARAKRSIESLAELRPTTALRIDESDDHVEQVPIEQLRIGDTVLVRPDSRIAADGVVVSGESSVDQSIVTGESLPVDKLPLDDFDPSNVDWQQVPLQHKVFAGSINGDGAMRLRVTRRAEDMTLMRITRLVTETRALRSPTQRLTDSLERYFVPAILLLVVLLPLAFLVLDESFSASLYRAIAVLVAASPCALALATPSAVLSAVARGGRGGVLFKGGGPLEQLGSVRVVAWDKTGTLTLGRPEVVAIRAAPSCSEAEVLAVAAAVERHSDHPLARAIVAAAEATADDRADHPGGRAEVSDVHRLTGLGICATVDGTSVWVGNGSLFNGPRATAPALPPLPPWVLQAEAAMHRAGQTTMIVSREATYLGVIALADTPRPSAAGCIDALRALGIEQQLILSGDNPSAVAAVAAQVGIDQAQGQLSPEDKLEMIQRMDRRPVAMIGDGVNDAPALAAADVSVAIAAAGSDVALETADVALMSDDLHQLPFAILLSRRAARVIRQNLWISLGMIAVLVPAALFGLQLAIAVVFHEGSTLLVVVNALRLLGFHPRMPEQVRGTRVDPDSPSVHPIGLPTLSETVRG